MNHKKKIGLQLKKIRQDLELSQQESAERAGISSATWSQIENGYRYPHDATADKIAAAFGVELDALSSAASTAAKTQPDDLKSAWVEIGRLQQQIENYKQYVRQLEAQ